MRTSPPPTPAVRAALSRLGKEGDLTAALHLALPVDVPAHAVQRHRGRLYWRTVDIAVDDDVARLAAIVAMGGHREGDRYLDVHAEPHALVKWIHSGTRLYAHGLGIVIDGPNLTADAAVPVELRDRLVAMAADRRRPVPPFVVNGDGRSCIVEGDDDNWHAVADSGAVALATGVIDRTALALSVVARLGGELEILDDDAVIVVVDRRWVLTVPIECHGPSASVGVATVVPGDLPHPDAIPDGFAAIGFDPHGDLVLAHGASGVRCLLTGDLSAW